MEMSDVVIVLMG